MKLDYLDIARIVRRDDSDVVVACLAIVGGISESDIVLTMQKTLQRKLDTLGRELSELEQLVNVKATNDNDLPLSIVNAAIEHRRAWRADVRNAADQLRRLATRYREPVKLTLAQAVQTLRDQQQTGTKCRGCGIPCNTPTGWCQDCFHNELERRD